MTDGLSIEHVREAAERLAGRVWRTPVLRCPALEALAGRALFLKAENLQKIGAFKARGASSSRPARSSASCTASACRVSTTTTSRHWPAWESPATRLAVTPTSALSRASCASRLRAAMGCSGHTATAWK